MKLGQKFVKYFVRFLGNGVSRKKCFWDLLTFSKCQIAVKMSPIFVAFLENTNFIQARFNFFDPRPCPTSPEINTQQKSGDETKHVWVLWNFNAYWDSNMSIYWGYSFWTFRETSWTPMFTKCHCICRSQWYVNFGNSEILP